MIQIMETKGDAGHVSGMIRRNWTFIIWYAWVAVLLAALAYGVLR